MRAVWAAWVMWACASFSGFAKRKLRTNGQSLNGKQGTELADLIVHKITEAVNAISFK